MGRQRWAAGFPPSTTPRPAPSFTRFCSSTPSQAIQSVPSLMFFAICILGFALVAWRACRPSRSVRLSLAIALVTTAGLGYYRCWFAPPTGVTLRPWSGPCPPQACASCCGPGTVPLPVLIGLAACVKPFPDMFLLLLLRRRRYKEAVLGFLTAGLLVIAASDGSGAKPLEGISVPDARHL